MSETADATDATPRPPDIPEAREPLLALLTGWMPNQRWFAGDHLPPGALDIVRRRPVATTETVAIESLLLSVDDGPDRSIYHLLLGWRGKLHEGIDHAVIGAVADVFCFDAVHDHEVSSLIVRAIAGRATLGDFVISREPGREVSADLSGLVMTAEQSNTSIVFGEQAIVKFFRRVQPGTNPDAEVLAALTSVAAGPRHSPALLAEIRDPAGPDGAATTLAVATEFFANSADGWSMATASVRDLMGEADLHADEVGGDFAAEAHRLGGAVASVHRDMADVLGDSVAGGDEITAMIDTIRRRTAAACAATPPLAPYADAVAATLDRHARQVAARTMPIQRIHGDLHLGQVLRTLQGWVVIDFEGEPGSPLAERRALRSPLVDIAGMLRSFQYAAHHMLIGAAPDPQRSYRAGEWATRNRTAFCDGYAEASGSDPRERQALLAAFELDKAVYEVAYETRHRPAWAVIPLAAIAELTGSSPDQGASR